MDDYKADISFEGKNGSKKNTKRFFRHAVSLWIAAKYNQIHHSLNILNS